MTQHQNIEIVEGSPYTHSEFYTSDVLLYVVFLLWIPLILGVVIWQIFQKPRHHDHHDLY